MNELEKVTAAKKEAEKAINDAMRKLKSEMPATFQVSNQIRFIPTHGGTLFVIDIYVG